MSLLILGVFINEKVPNQENKCLLSMKIKRYDIGPALRAPHKNDSMDVSNSFSLIFGF